MHVMKLRTGLHRCSTADDLAVPQPVIRPAEKIGERRAHNVAIVQRRHHAAALDVHDTQIGMAKAQAALWDVFRIKDALQPSGSPCKQKPTRGARGYGEVNDGKG